MWARVEVDGSEDDADLGVDYEVRAGGATLARQMAGELGNAHFWVSGGAFTVLVCRIGDAAVGAPLVVRARVHWRNGPALIKARLFVST